MAGSLPMHAIIHAAVETQLAEGHGHALKALRRLLDEGLDRHDAVHAVGSVLAEQIYGALKGSSFDEAAYQQGLDALSAESWHHSGEAE